MNSFYRWSIGVKARSFKQSSCVNIFENLFQGPDAAFVDGIA
jgi:hypothetical protein